MHVSRLQHATNKMYSNGANLLYFHKKIYIIKILIKKKAEKLNAFSD